MIWTKAKDKTARITLHPATVAMIFAVGWAIGIRMGSETVQKNSVAVLRSTTEQGRG